jgi:hypothetical protein
MNRKKTMEIEQVELEAISELVEAAARVLREIPNRELDEEKGEEKNAGEKRR